MSDIIIQIIAGRGLACRIKRIRQLELLPKIENYRTQGDNR